MSIKKGKRKCKECGQEVLIIPNDISPDLCQECYEREMGLDINYNREDGD